MRAAVIAAFLGGMASATAPARAAEPAIGDCLMAAEASLKLRSEHKLKQTRTQLLVCSAASCPLEVRQECVRRIDEVNAAQPTIVLAVKNAAGKDLIAVKVTVDGQVMADHLDGSALAIDPGAHEFTFEARGLPVVTETVVLHEGEKDRRENVVLGTPEPQPQVVSAPPPKPGTAPESSAEGSSGGGGSLRLVGLVIGGVGIAGVGVGAIFGALGSSSWKTAQQDCPTHTGCSSKAMNERSSALTDATVSTVGFIAGGVLAATGLTLFLVAPKDAAPTPAVGLRVAPGSLLLTGEF